MFFFCFSLFAQKSTARFLLWQPSAKSMALGGIGSAIIENGFSSFYNPAILAHSRRILLSGSFVKPIPFWKDEVHSYITASFNTKSFGTFAGTANLFWKGQQPVTLETGPEIVDGFDEFSWQGKLSYATFIKQNVSIGLSMALLRYELSEFSVGREVGDGKSTSFMMDVGVLISQLIPNSTVKLFDISLPNFLQKITYDDINQGINFGVAVLNLGPKLSFIDANQADPLPTVLNFGIGYWPVNSNLLSLLFVADFENQIYESSNFDYVHIGSELQIVRMFCVRIGNFIDSKNSDSSFFTWGFGIRTKFLSANIARYKKAIFSSWHFDGTISLEF